MASQATREKVKGKTKEMKGGISAQKRAGFYRRRGGKSACGRVRSWECVRAFSASAERRRGRRTGVEGVSFVHGERWEGEVRGGGEVGGRSGGVCH